MSADATDREMETLLLLRTALAASTDGVVVVDARGNRVFVNDACRRLGCLEDGEAIDTPGKTAEIPLRYPDGRPLAPDDTPLSRALHGESIADLLAVFDAPAGDPLHLSITANPVRDRQGRIVGAVAIFRDVTAHLNRRREQEHMLAQLEALAAEAQRRAAELQATIDNMADGVFVCDLAGRMTLVNEAGLALFGITRDADMGDVRKGMPPWLVVRGADGSPLLPGQGALVRALRGEAVAQQEAIVRDPATGRETYLRTSAAPIRDRHGEITGAVAVASDITGLRELDRLKDQFIAVAAHELKTPLTIMKGYSQVLLRQPETITAFQQRMLRAIERGTDRIGAIVEDLLDISQLQQGLLHLHLESVDLVDLITEAASRWEVLAPKHHLHILRAEPITLQGDRYRLWQVLNNLINNAVKYSPNGGDVELTLLKQGDEAVLAVRDRGIGIPTDKQDGIFQRFFRAHTGTPDDYGGIGVGLYISKAIVERHGGRIWFESEKGHGSTFSFALPLAGRPDLD